MKRQAFLKYKHVVPWNGLHFNCLPKTNTWSCS